MKRLTKCRWHLIVVIRYAQTQSLSVTKMQSRPGLILPFTACSSGRMSLWRTIRRHRRSRLFSCSRRPTLRSRPCRSRRTGHQDRATGRSLTRFATRATRSRVTSPSRTPVKTTFRLTSQSRKRPTSSLVSLNTQMLSSRTSVQE